DIVEPSAVPVLRRGSQPVHTDLLERAEVDAVPADHRLGLDLAGGEHPLFLRAPVHDVKAFAAIPLDDRFRDHAADLEAVAFQHLDDLEEAVGLASAGEAGDSDFQCLSHATTQAP